MDQRLYVRPKTLKLLQENTWKAFEDIAEETTFLLSKK
jgi:hypothetical protein